MKRECDGTALRQARLSPAPSSVRALEDPALGCGIEDRGVVLVDGEIEDVPLRQTLVRGLPTRATIGALEYATPGARVDDLRAPRVDRERREAPLCRAVPSARARCTLSREDAAHRDQCHQGPDSQGEAAHARNLTGAFRDHNSTTDRNSCRSRRRERWVLLGPGLSLERADAEGEGEPDRCEHASELAAVAEGRRQEPQADHALLGSGGARVRPYRAAGLRPAVA